MCFYLRFKYFSGNVCVCVVSLSQPSNRDHDYFLWDAPEIKIKINPASVLNIFIAYRYLFTAEAVNENHISYFHAWL